MEFAQRLTPPPSEGDQGPQPVATQSVVKTTKEEDKPVRPRKGKVYRVLEQTFNKYWDPSHRVPTEADTWIYDILRKNKVRLKMCQVKSKVRSLLTYWNDKFSKYQQVSDIRNLVS